MDASQIDSFMAAQGYVELEVDDATAGSEARLWVHTSHIQSFVYDIDPRTPGTPYTLFARLKIAPSRHDPYNMFRKVVLRD